MSKRTLSSVSLASFNHAIVSDKKEKAELLYLRGRALDFLPEYTKMAEDMLSKSLKL